MKAWRALTFKHLFKPGYNDRFTYYTQMFALTIAIIGLLGLILSVVQTAYTIKGINVALQSLEVSLEALQLQKQQMNMAGTGSSL